MKKVLMLTYGDDPHANSVSNYFDSCGVDYFRIDTEKLIDNYKITFDSNSSLYKISSDSRSEFIDGDWNIWNRRLLDPDMIKKAPKNIEEMVFEETQRTWDGLLQSHLGKVVNRPLNQKIANNKINQLVLAKKLGGVYVPNTVVTNDPLVVKEFYEDNDENICFKLQKGIVLESSNGYLTVYTNKVSKGDLENVNLVSSHPCLFQEYIEKDFEFRVVSTKKGNHSIGIYSQNSDISKVDYRKYDFDNVPYEKINLPIETENFCSNMLNHYNLDFGVFDFIRSENGEDVFLELNPNGQWLWLEDLAKYNLTEHVGNNLLN